MLNIVPLYDRVVIRRLKPAEKTATGKLVIPDQARDESLLGIVEAVGGGKNYDGPGEVTVAGTKDRFHATFERRPPILKAGDLVTFGKWSGTVIQLTADGEPLFVMREDEVVGRFDGTAEELAQAIEDFEQGRSVLKLALHAAPKPTDPTPAAREEDDA